MHRKSKQKTTGPRGQRPYWRGHLKLSLVTCPIAIYSAVTDKEDLHLHFINPDTGNRIKYQVVDAETGDELARSDLVRGYEYAKGRYVTLTEEELKDLKVESSDTVTVERFVDAAPVEGGGERILVQERLHLLELRLHRLDAALRLCHLAPGGAQLALAAPQLPGLGERPIEHRDDGGNVAGAPDALGERVHAIPVRAQRAARRARPGRWLGGARSRPACARLRIHSSLLPAGASGVAAILARCHSGPKRREEPPCTGIHADSGAGTVSGRVMPASQACPYAGSG